ncbi:hypothetical protein [Streptomyces roseolilacinus]|uniref:hypothetical protein n=1 Tax=Streptomyces roseolilacinus TaxID=66904 RepID=UPI00380CB81F
MTTEHAPRRFGPEFVAEQRRRYAKRPPEGRMLSYDLAVLDEYEPWRIWLDHPVEMDPLSPPRWTMPPELAGVLWVDNDFPFPAAWRPNPAASTPAPPALGVQDPSEAA